MCCQIVSNWDRSTLSCTIGTGRPAFPIPVRSAPRLADKPNKPERSRSDVDRFNAAFCEQPGSMNKRKRVQRTTRTEKRRLYSTGSVCVKIVGGAIIAIIYPRRTMKQTPEIQNSALYRRLLVEWYHSPQGASLRALESDYLSRSVSFRYNQNVLQIGSLGWENDYIDQDCRYTFLVVDSALLTDSSTSRIIARCDRIPIESESIDVVIIPHCLEFEPDQHGVLREAERVLKPEGQFILLGFNPWSLQSFYHFRQGRRGVVPWCGNFLSYPRIRDWLSLLNFEHSVKSGVYFKQSSVTASPGSRTLSACTALGYGIRAIKRRYTLIPLKPAKATPRNLVAADIAPTRYGSHD